MTLPQDSGQATTVATENRSVPVAMKKIRSRRNSLVLADTLLIDEWKQIGRQIAAISESSVWWLGDWLLFGQARYPDRYQRAINETNLDYQTLRNYAWVAGKFPPARRHPGLSFQHHAEVAALPPDEQDRWLSRAQRHSWSRNELRNRARAARNAAREVTGPRMTHVEMRIDDRRHQAWEAAASRSRRNLVDWMTAVLDQVAGAAESTDATAVEIVVPRDGTDTSRPHGD
ncbi:hypothetical protein FHR81_004733 [Actinoalloteichus hoggarensis]|uniref:Uncharacterized protein n=1 Tax=Actinoalloteichus hoggarensis TaxID=1470176 RepID=A0A221W4P1_9PSEU|nr:LmbU family transcriptional regulator [Actinoalloteichus hoggarensis]ASO20621.1 hypothetical protein AHOG_14900 [Actinoalloteichus hoggarensis]MBB5923662.1 hypothetical protein [Actinoalloteichus hoggarensis]